MKLKLAAAEAYRRSYNFHVMMPFHAKDSGMCLAVDAL